MRSATRRTDYLFDKQPERIFTIIYSPEIIGIHIETNMMTKRAFHLFCMEAVCHLIIGFLRQRIDGS